MRFLLHDMQITLDAWLERIFFISPKEASTTAQNPRKLFGIALLISALRCIVQYIVLPFILPLLGMFSAIPLWASLLLSFVALISLLRSLRILWQYRHPKRFAYLPLAALMLGVLLIFITSDLRHLRL